MTGASVRREGDTLRLSLARVDRGLAGDLTCEADNGFQDTPVTKTVKVRIGAKGHYTYFKRFKSRSMLNILRPLRYPKPS